MILGRSGGATVNWWLPRRDLIVVEQQYLVSELLPDTVDSQFVRKTMNFVSKTRNAVSKTKNCVLKTRNFVLKMMNFGLKMMNFGLKMMNFVLKMMNRQGPKMDATGTC